MLLYSTARNQEVKASECSFGSLEMQGTNVAVNVAVTSEYEETACEENGIAAVQGLGNAF